MDLLTQGILGAAAAQAGARKVDTRLATSMGFIAGMLPDADALIRSNEDPLLVLEYHRHFSHSLVFIPVAALLVAVITWLILKKRPAFSRLFIYALLGVGLAGLLDACTSYGTNLLWPFSDQRIAWNIIAIIDPVFTLLLLIPLLLGLIRHSPRASRWGLGLAALYLGLATLQSFRAYSIAEQLSAGRNHQVERLLVKPTLANLMLWRSLYIADGRIFVDAVRPGIFSDARIYPGASLPRLNPQTSSPFPAGSRGHTDLLRFARFSDDWLAYAPSQPELVGDARYAMLPNSIDPLWGVRLDLNRPNEALPFITSRHFTRAMRYDFIQMVLGRDLADE